MILRELHSAWRRWCRRPGYAALSIAVLGVGLGVVLFLFSLVNTLMLQPLPFPQPERLVGIGELHDTSGGAGDSGNGIGDIDSEQYRLLHDGLVGPAGRSRPAHARGRSRGVPAGAAAGFAGDRAGLTDAAVARAARRSGDCLEIRMTTRRAPLRGDDDMLR